MTPAESSLAARGATVQAGNPCPPLRVVNPWEKTCASRFPERCSMPPSATSILDFISGSTNLSRDRDHLFLFFAGITGVFGVAEEIDQDLHHLVLIQRHLRKRIVFPD